MDKAIKKIKKGQYRYNEEILENNREKTKRNFMQYKK